ncbi:MAG: glycosyltransferase family 4 protein [Planctomycetota bacterium]|nr:glycosyltransferase family 4 protein [Planctomycetota bacterium]
MKITHVITRMVVGGAQENTLLTVEGFLRRGCRVSLISGPAEGPEGSLLDRAWRSGAEVHIVPDLGREISPARDMLACIRIRRLLKTLAPDLVHTHSAKAGVLGRMAAASLGIPWIVHTYHGLPFHPYERPWRNWLYIRMERYCARLTHRIISVCDAMTRQALAAGVGSPRQYATVYSGIETEKFLRARAPGERAELRRRLGLEPSDVAILKIARLFHLKGHDAVLRAAPLVLRKVPHAVWVFAGDGVLRDELEGLTVNLGIGDRVRFLGIVPPDGIPDVLAACDLLVHASLREGLARALPQAMLSGLPAVSLNLDGAPEVVLPGRTGLLVAPGDLEGLAEAQISLCLDPELRSRMGREGRELCREKFDWRRMVDALAGIYAGLLGRADGQPGCGPEPPSGSAGRPGLNLGN